MKTLSLLLSVVFTTAIISGCSQNIAPECATSDVKNLVIKVATDELVRQIGQAGADSITLALSDIQTTGSDKATGSQHCSANLAVIGPKDTKSIKITYKTDLNADDNSFTVSVSGL